MTNQSERRFSFSDRSTVDLRWHSVCVAFDCEIPVYSVLNEFCCDGDVVSVVLSNSELIDV